MTEAVIIEKPAQPVWFLYDNDLRHERVKTATKKLTVSSSSNVPG